MKIFGNWDVKVETPFGIEDYALVIDEFDLAVEYSEEITGRVSNQKDSVSFDNGKVVNDIFTCSFDTEFPIKSKVFIQIDKLEEDKIFGHLTIDQYLTAHFSGVNNVSV